MKKVWLFLAFVLLATTSFAQHSTEEIWNRVYGSITSNCVVNSNADTLATTTINSNSNSGQKDLNVASSSGFAASQWGIVGYGTARVEAFQVSSVSTGKITAVSNLTYSHTAAQADPVTLTNRIGSLTSDALYAFSCQDSSGVGVVCDIMQGTDTVSAGSSGVYPLELFAGERPMLRIHPSYLYVSVIPKANDTVFRACPMTQQ